MNSARYFQDRAVTRAALARYAHFASGQGEKAWSIASSKLALYRQGVTAFGDNGAECARRESHEKIYGDLRSWWGVARNGILWDAATVFDVLNNQCQMCSRSSGVTLATLDCEPNQQRVLACLNAMRGLKVLTSGRYPVMAVSKNLHFFNQRLWVIYDNEVIVNKVYRVFKRDWDSFYNEMVVDARDAEIDFYLAYLLWASHAIRNSYEGLMEDFAEWFIETVSSEANALDFRAELQLSYATAFEFIAIGAAYLESTSLSDLCE